MLIHFYTVDCILLKLWAVLASFKISSENTQVQCTFCERGIPQKSHIMVRHTIVINSQKHFHIFWWSQIERFSNDQS
jgi:hypothetical protein